jgi:2-methylisocitrate lyase-like PEP mutase family enzyme
MAGNNIVRKTTRLKRLFERPEIVVLPGGADPISARMVERAGFECFYLGGMVTSAYLLGLPDGSASQRDMIDAARRICLSVDLPVFADMDTGYGDALTVYNTVREYIQAGVAGAHLEDRVLPPKSGPRASFVTADEMIGKIRAAMDAKMELDPDFVVVARSDRLMEYNPGVNEAGDSTVPREAVEEAIERAVLYKEATDVDVTCVYINTSWEDAKESIRRIPGLVLPLMGRPDIQPSLEEQEEGGACAAWYPAMTTMAGLQANWELLSDFHDRGAGALRDATSRMSGSKWGVVTIRDFAMWSESQSRESKYLPPLP